MCATTSHDADADGVTTGFGSSVGRSVGLGQEVFVGFGVADASATGCRSASPETTRQNLVSMTAKWQRLGRTL
jgi:hypothetical protein